MAHSNQLKYQFKSQRSRPPAQSAKCHHLTLFSLLSTLTLFTLLTLSTQGTAVAKENQAQPHPNNLQSLMLYRSAIQDAINCQVTVKRKKPTFSNMGDGSAATTCPDAFAWVQFLEAIQQNFWNWSIDQSVWPAEPWPLCGKANNKNKANTANNNCCNPGSVTAEGSPQMTHCPYFRADYKPVPALPATPNGTPSRGVINHRGLNITDTLDPGRLLRDLELELVFRNRPMFDYIYAKDLYNKEGLGQVNQKQNDALAAGNIGQAQRLQVRFPVEAVMVKADFIHQEIMLAQGLIQKKDKDGKPLIPPQNPEYPYVTVYLTGTGAQNEVPGLYYLVAMTNASKAIPIWHWYAMEHVANRGRCDYIGCNDSFGYRANGKAQAGADYGTHFIPPKIALNDDKTQNNDPLFETGKVYHPTQTGEAITPELKKLYQKMGIASSKNYKQFKKLSSKNPAWLNYRLKGSQSSFTTANGIPTGTGATVTEGGFVNSASCATCHAQAAVDNTGSFALKGVGATWRPNLFGYQQVVMGSPNMDWFFTPGTTNFAASQIDFVWGILNASCINPAENGNGCAP